MKRSKNYGYYSVFINDFHMMGHIFYDILITKDLYTITNFKSETCRSSQNGKNYSKMRMIRSTNVIFKYGQIILNMELFILEYAPAVTIGVGFAFNNYNRNTLRRRVALKIRVSSQE